MTTYFCSYWTGKWSVPKLRVKINRLLTIVKRIENCNINKNSGKICLLCVWYNLASDFNSMLMLLLYCRPICGTVTMYRNFLFLHTCDGHLCKNKIVCISKIFIIRLIIENSLIIYINYQKTSIWIQNFYSFCWIYSSFVEYKTMTQ